MSEAISIKNELVSEKIYNGIKNGIMSGKYPPGFHLIEADLEEEYNASRVSVRDALKRLMGDDLLEQIPHKGMRIRKLSFEDIKEIYVVREYLDGLAARLLAESNNTEIIEKLSALMEDDEQAVKEMDFNKHLDLLVNFHKLVAIGSNNKTLIKSLDRLHSVLEIYSHHLIPQIKVTHERHAEILDAIKKGDGALAEERMRNNIRLVRESYIEYYSRNEL